MTVPFPGEVFESTLTSYFLTLTFKAPKSPEAVMVALPLVVAKQLCMVLRRQLRQYEQTMDSPLVVPKESYQTMGVSPEDWENWLK